MINLYPFLLTQKNLNLVEISGDQIDDTSITMNYSNGICVFIYCSRISNTYDQRVEIFGDEGNLTIKNPFG